MPPEWRLEEYAMLLRQADYLTRDSISSVANGDWVLKFSQLLSPGLLCQPPPTNSSDHKLWVFSTTTQEPSSSSSSSSRRICSKLTEIEETIKTFLGHYSCRSSNEGILIQFWAPLPTKMGQCILSTLDQPFAMNNPHAGLCSYRNASLGYRFVVEEDGNSENDQLLFGGILGRVFRNRWPESTPDVSYYSAIEYPQRDLALSCGVQGSFAWPVWEPSGDARCVGVLEIVATHECIGRYGKLQELFTQQEPLESPFAFTFRKIQERLEPAADQILAVLAEMCKKQQIVLAQTWVQLKYTTTMVNCSILDLNYNAFGLSCPKELLVAINSEGGTCNMAREKFTTTCNRYPLRKGEGLVGKALASHKSCYCKDVSQLRMTEYSLSHYARNCGFTGCFAIPLRSCYTGGGDVDYVLEIFLHPEDSEDPLYFLVDIMATIRQNLQGFKVASGEELGAELFIKVYKDSLKDEYGFFKVCQTTASTIQIQCLESDEEVVVLDPPESIMDDYLQHEKRTSGDGIGNSVIPLDETCLTRTSKRAQRDTEGGIGFEDLKEYFGFPLDDAAQMLNVSRSTFKRLCRKHGISRWPGCRSKKMRGILSNSNIRYGNKCSGIGKEQTTECSSRKPSVPDVHATQGTTDVAQAIPQVSQIMNNITVKATYNGVLIKFQLSFSSRLAELEEKVQMRLHLKDGSFSIKYEDEESEWVLITCDEDLQDCMESSRSLNKTTIRMIVDLPINNQTA